MDYLVPVAVFHGQNKLRCPKLVLFAHLMYATKLMTRSTFETAQMATGLSLLAMVDKDGEMKILRLGPVSRSLFASIDEMNKLTNTDQEKFYGVMQEGYFTNNKFAKNQKVVTPVTILASMNPPERSTPDVNGRIDLTDMNVIRPIRDRFDLKFYIPPMKDERERRELAYAKAELEGLCWAQALRIFCSTHPFQSNFDIPYVIFLLGLGAC
jgi:DNA replicative helicase MCM subunit Mcm2 (Cdc46/Mcm family)